MQNSSRLSFDGNGNVVSFDALCLIDTMVIEKNNINCDREVTVK